MTESATPPHALRMDGRMGASARPVYEHGRTIRVVCECGWDSGWNTPENVCAHARGHLAHFWAELIRAVPRIEFCVSCKSATREPVEVAVVNPGTGPIRALYSCVDCLPHTAR